ERQPAASTPASGRELDPRSGGVAGSPAPRPVPRVARENLGAERRLLDVARGALARRDGSTALAALHRHAVRFPDGRLSEEREGMRVAALVLVGDYAAARSRAAAFRRHFPGSLFEAAVRAALAHVP